MGRPAVASAEMVRPNGFPLRVVESLPGAVERIVEVLSPERIVLFGSYAYGTPDGNSDVDLLVVMQTDLPSHERYLAVSRLLRPRPFPVDILVKTPAEVERSLAEGDFFVREILSRGEVLYERGQ